MYLNDDSLDMEVREIPGDRPGLLVLKALDLVDKSANKHSSKTRIEPPNIIVFLIAELFIVYAFIPVESERDPFW